MNASLDCSPRVFTPAPAARDGPEPAKTLSQDRTHEDLGRGPYPEGVPPFGLQQVDAAQLPFPGRGFRLWPRVSRGCLQIPDRAQQVQARPDAGREGAPCCGGTERPSNAGRPA